MTEADLLRELSVVQDPDLHHSIVDLGMIQSFAWDGTALSFTCELTTPACPVKEQIEAQIREVIAAKFPEVKTVNLNMTGKVRNALGLTESDRANLIPQIQKVVLIASGKGGTGKSTLALHLALALHQSGARTALLDLDLHAPALPWLLQRFERPKIQSDQQIEPLQALGLEVMSMGFLVEPHQAMLWRGQIIQGLVTQFLKDVTWSERDYLVIDLPTSASDVLLAVNHCCPVSGAVLITTPDHLSRETTWRMKALLEQTRVPVLGIIENLSDGSSSNDFAQKLGIPCLGSIPNDPAFNTKPEHSMSSVSIAVRKAAENMAAQISIRNAQPT